MFICAKKQIQKVVKLKLCYDDINQDKEIEIKKGILIRVVFIKNEAKNEVIGRVAEVRDNMIILDTSYIYNGEIIGILYTAIRDIEELTEDSELVETLNGIKEQVNANAQSINQIQSGLVWDDM